MAIQILKHARSVSPEPSTNASKKTKLQSKTVPVNFLIISDAHDAEIALPSCDVLLHCGDLTEDGSPASLKTALKALGKADAELKLVIAGDHEISLNENFYRSQGGSKETHMEARALISAHNESEASKNGITFLSEGTHTFTLNSGAIFTIYALPYTPQFGLSAFQYPSHEDRFNNANFTPKWAKNVGTEESIILRNVDIVMTHGPAKYLLDATPDGRSAGCEHLHRAIAQNQPRSFCFGHIHGGYGAQRIEYDNTKKPDDDSDCIRSLPKEWVGKNQAK